MFRRWWSIMVKTRTKAINNFLTSPALCFEALTFFITVPPSENWCLKRLAPNRGYYLKRLKFPFISSFQGGTLPHVAVKRFVGQRPAGIAWLSDSQVGNIGMEVFNGVIWHFCLNVSLLTIIVISEFATLDKYTFVLECRSDNEPSREASCLHEKKKSEKKFNIYFHF